MKLRSLVVCGGRLVTSYEGRVHFYRRRSGAGARSRRSGRSTSLCRQIAVAVSVAMTVVVVVVVVVVVYVRVSLALGALWLGRRGDREAGRCRLLVAEGVWAPPVAATPALLARPEDHVDRCFDAAGRLLPRAAGRVIACCVKS